MRIRRLAKIRPRKPRYDLDSYIPSGFSPTSPRLVKENPIPLQPENQPASTEVANSSEPEPAAVSNTQREAPRQDAAAESSPRLVSTEPVSRGGRPSVPSLATSHSPLATGPSHHGRRCTICSHPLRDAIEADFLRWRSPDEITREYRIGSRTSIYRHANATGLFRRRKEQFARVLEYFLEQAETCSLEEATVIIRAARIYAHLDHHGKWVESPRTNYIYHGPAPLPPVGKQRSLGGRSFSSDISPATSSGVLTPEPSAPDGKANKNQKAKKRLIGTRGN